MGYQGIIRRASLGGKNGGAGRSVKGVCSQSVYCFCRKADQTALPDYLTGLFYYAFIRLAD